VFAPHFEGGRMGLFKPIVKSFAQRLQIVIILFTHLTRYRFLACETGESIKPRARARGKVKNIFKALEESGSR
jgi:hypothetical protein